MSAEIFQKMANAEPPGENFIRIATGQHLLALKDYAIVPTQRFGKAVEAQFVTMESTFHDRGTIVQNRWFVSRQTQFGKDFEAGRAMQFVLILLGLSDSNAAAANAQALCGPEKPGRGILIRAFGNAMKTKEGKDFVAVNWKHVEGQTPESIKQNRVFVDAVDAGTVPIVGKQEAPAQSVFQQPQVQQVQKSSLLGGLV